MPIASKACPVGHDLRRGNETFARSPNKSGPRSDHLPGETSADDRDQRDDERLDVAKTFVLQKQDHQHIERGDADADEERDFEEQIATRSPSR